MRKNMRLSLAVIALLITAVSCQKAVAPEQEIQKEVTQDVINSVKALGFSSFYSRKRIEAFIKWCHTARW
jgi:hypothetical protein